MTFKAKTPHFFKIILDANIRDGKQLGIPTKFVSKYANCLSNKAFLKVPNGPKWQVELVKNGEHVCFGKGWLQFLDFYSISHGSFLVFGLEHFENCCFNVMIFDKSCLEIDYPFHFGGDNEEPNLEEIHGQTTPQITEIDHSPPRKSEEKSALPFSRPRKKMIHHNCTELAKDERFAKRTHKLTAKEKEYALNRAKTYYKSNNPCISIAMQPTHVGGKFNVVIPSRSAKIYFNKRRGHINLKSVDKRTWPVEYVNRKANGSNIAVICGGWRKFAQDNHLAVGDICIFELINGSASELQVVICRENQDAKRIPSAHCTINFKAKCKNESIKKATLQTGE